MFAINVSQLVYACTSSNGWEFCYYNNDNRVSNAEPGWAKKRKKKKKIRRGYRAKFCCPRLSFQENLNGRICEKLMYPSWHGKIMKETWNKILSSKVSVSRSSKTEHTWFFKFIFLKNSRHIKRVDTRKCLITFANRYLYALLTNHRSFVCAGIYLNRSQTPCTLCARYCYESD